MLKKGDLVRHKHLKLTGMVLGEKEEFHKFYIVYWIKDVNNILSPNEDNQKRYELPESLELFDERKEI